MNQLTIKKTTYEVLPFVGETAITAVIDLAEDVSNLEKQDRFVRAIAPQIVGLETEDIAVERDGKFLLSLNIEQYFKLLLDLQGIAYKDVLDIAVNDSERLSEIRMAKALCRWKEQSAAFEKAMLELDEEWLNTLTSLSNIKLEKSDSCQRELFNYWQNRFNKAESDEDKKFAKSQLSKIPKAYGTKTSEI